MKIKIFLKKLGFLLFALLKAILEYGLFIVAAVAVFYDRPLSVIFCIVMAMALEYKKYVDFKIKNHTRRPKDILEKVKRARFDSVTVRYGRQWKHDVLKERSAFQTGFDAGCDFILNLEEK